MGIAHARLTGREAPRRAALLGAMAGFGGALQRVRGAEGPRTLSVPPLGYPFDALEPHIDAQTMAIHHDKHHAGYVANLNKAIAQCPALAGRPIKATSNQDTPLSKGRTPLPGMDVREHAYQAL